jgi:hypothetical protein
VNRRETRDTYPYVRGCRELSGPLDGSPSEAHNCELPADHWGHHLCPTCGQRWGAPRRGVQAPLPPV